jgi:hypothetical protein
MKTQSLDALHRVVTARFLDYQQKLAEARTEEWHQLQKKHPVFMQWAYYTFSLVLLCYKSADTPEDNLEGSIVKVR